MYFPTGLAVSPGGGVLYVANSNFDLQYDGGTLQAYDLGRLRNVAKEVADTFTAPCETVRHGTALRFVRFGASCAAPAPVFWRNARTIGAFATDLQLSPFGFLGQGIPSRRLFMPVRGNASITWVDVPDDGAGAPPEQTFGLRCGATSEVTGITSRGGTCDDGHQAGRNPDELGNSRKIALPGEPFGMAFSEDGESLVVTHQTVEQTSLLATGYTKGQSTGPIAAPHLDFILDGVVNGGIGVTAIPHDAQAFPGPGSGTPPRPAFLQSSRLAPELTLLRNYPDGRVSADTSSLLRPFLVKETTFPVNANANGTDSRGVLIDPTPRIVCKAAVKPANPSAKPPRTAADVANDIALCARTPARLFLANRSPASLVIGEVGEETTFVDGNYDADKVRVFENIPLSAGPSKLYLAPIVDRDGALALRLFIVCFDAATIFVYDPELRVIENVIRTELGPFAMAFDPFNLDDAALHAKVGDRTFDGVTQHTFRYGYVADFTNSVVQVIDLDNGRPGTTTFERILMSLGEPTQPKGTN